MATAAQRAAKAAKTDQPKTIYTVASPLDHNGERYAEGDEVELAELDAAPLLLVGAVKAAASN